jgi:hypothetical protein
MSDNPQLRREELSPGEARTRQRQRRQNLYFLGAVGLGGAIGFFTGFFDQGDGNLFAGDWEGLKLPPVVAILVIIALAAGFLALPLWGFTQIDAYKREQNLIAYTAAAMAVIAGFPIWAVLYAGGFSPAPHAFGIFAIAFVSMMLTFLYLKIRE